MMMSKLDMKEYSQEELINWCIKRHKDTNHYYDEYLPYEFHLRMVAGVCEEFHSLVYNDLNYPAYRKLQLACYGHDLIEDARVSYNDVKNMLGFIVAEIVFALSTDRGRTREERANDDYYELIRNTSGATFVKLCDRIANVRYSKLTKSDFFYKYKKENDNFQSKLGRGTNVTLEPMFQYLEDLFKE